MENIIILQKKKNWGALVGYCAIFFVFLSVPFFLTQSKYLMVSIIGMIIVGLYCLLLLADIFLSPVIQLDAKDLLIYGERIELEKISQVSVTERKKGGYFVSFPSALDMCIVFDGGKKKNICISAFKGPITLLDELERRGVVLVYQNHVQKEYWKYR